MIEQRKDAIGNPPYWVCTNCKWAFAALQEANNHQCGSQASVKAFVSYSREPK